jgi:hypothetical protein
MKYYELNSFLSGIYDGWSLILYKSGQNAKKPAL